MLSGWSGRWPGYQSLHDAFLPECFAPCGHPRPLPSGYLLSQTSTPILLWDGTSIVQTRGPRVRRGTRIMDNYHAISVTNCLTTRYCFQYTDKNRSDRTAHEKSIST